MQNSGERSGNRGASSTLRHLREVLVRRVLPPILLGVYRLYGATWRYTVDDAARFKALLATDQPLVLAFLHARSFQLLRFFSQQAERRWVVLCSRSRDGDAMAHLEEGLGFTVVRGSSGRGGARALVALIKMLRDDRRRAAGLSIDGSRGPRGIAQLGGLVLSQKSGGLVVPTAASTRDCRVFARSWDRITIPKLFARIHIAVGEPIAVPADADEATLERMRVQLEQAVHTLHENLDRQAGFSDSEPLRLPSGQQQLASE
jgi:lysophospholipid acyltransferase (LPLAT)-like uncharacterized protein